MTIFERIKNKANQALQSVGNFIDRDKQMSGVQLVPGGWQGGVDRVKTLFQDNNFQKQAQAQFQPVRDFLNTPVNPNNPVARGLNFLDENFTKPIENTPIGTILNPRFVGERMLNQAEYAGKLGQERQEKINRGEQPTFWDEAKFGLNSLGAAVPGIDDIIFGGYDYAKARKAGQTPQQAQKAFVGSPDVGGGDAPGLGTSLFGDNLAGAITDVAELPLMIGSILMTGKTNQLDDASKRLSKLDDVLKRSNGADELVNPIKSAKDTIFVTPSGTAIKPRVQPKTTASLDEMLKQAEDVIPGGTKVADDIGGLLTAGKQKVQELPATIDGAVKTAKEQGDNFFQSLKKSKDVNTFDKIRLSRQQRLEKALPTNVYAKIKTNIVDRKNQLLAESIDWGKKYENVLEQLPIKIGSKEDKLIRELNAGIKTVDDLIAEVGDKKAAQIVDAHTAIRNMYDEMIGFINQRRSAEGLTEIPYKKDFLSQIGNKRRGNMVEDLFFGKDKTTGTFSQGIFKQQGDVNTDIGAIESMMSYLDYAKRAGFTDLVTPKLDEYINLAGKAGADQSIVKYLDDYRNEILGIRDSGLGDKFAAATGEIRGAAVLGNARSLVAQVYNLPQAIAEANPVNFVKGMFSKSAKAAESQSPLLKSLSERTSSKLVKGYDKIKKPAADALQEANNVTAKQIWRSFYEQGLSKKVDDVVQYADDLTVELMGDRRLGELGEYYQTWFGKTLSPFTLENQAAMNKLFKNVGEKKVGKVLGTLFAWKISNDLIENYGTGDRPFLDPADMLNDVYEQWYGTDQKEPDKVKAVARVFTELTNLVPVLQSPMFTATKFALGDKTKDIFGTDDPTWMNALSLYDIRDVGRNVTGNKLIDVPLNLASKVTPYTNQVARTTQAAISQGRGYTESRRGNPMFETPDNLFDKGRALLFGQNSTKEAREMFDNEFDWGLTDKQAEVMDQIPDREGKLEFLRNAKDKNISDKQLDAILNSDGGSVSVKQGDLKSSVFENKSATSKSVKERMDTYKELNKILSDETLPESYKKSAIEAAGADPKEAEYYTQAAQDVDVKLQDVILPKLDTMSNEEVMDYLGSQRRVVGGKQVLTSTMIDYLYERDYISNDQKKALKALQYDEITGEFYYKKSYKGGGGSGKMTYKQAVKAFNIDLPKFSKLKSLDLMFEPIAGSTSQTARDGERLLSDILNTAPKKGGSGSSNRKLWFNT